MILNETPIRTSRNYGINNIKIDDIELPKNIKNFDGLKIIGINENINIEETKLIIDLEYGNGKELDDLCQNSSNKDLKISIKGNNKEDFILNFDFSKNNNCLIENIVVELEEKSKSNVIFKFESENDVDVFHNGKIRVMAHKNSKSKITIVNLLNNKANSFIAIENVQEENSKLEYVTVEFSGKNTVTNYYTNLQGSGSKNKISTIYLGNENQVIDLNYIVNVYGEKSSADIDVKGAIKDKCKKHFKGTIDFKKGCKKSKGNEDEYCTILSDTAKSIALPMLLCTEEDIEGNHSTSAGKIDKKQLFYLMSRGFDLESAEKLIVRASLNKILEKITNEEIKNRVLKEFEVKL